MLAMSLSFTLLRDRLAVHWFACDLVLLFFPLIFDDYVATCRFACFSHAAGSFSSVFKYSTLFTSCHTDMVLYTNISQLCSCQNQKAEKRTKQHQRQEVPFFPFLLGIML